MRLNAAVIRQLAVHVDRDGLAVVYADVLQLGVDVLVLRHRGHRRHAQQQRHRQQESKQFLHEHNLLSFLEHFID